MLLQPFVLSAFLFLHPKVLWKLSLLLGSIRRCPVCEAHGAQYWRHFPGWGVPLVAVLLFVQSLTRKDSA